MNITGTKNIRVWVIEDNALFSRGVIQVIDGSDGMSCEKTFQAAEPAIELIQRRRYPDVILLDIQLSGMDGLEALRKIRKIAPQIKVVILTVFNDPKKIFKATCSGASGYILKSFGMDKIGQAIREVMRGGAHMTPEVAQEVLTAFTNLNNQRNKPDDHYLSQREVEIIELMAEGLAKKEIADKLSISIHTVGSHLRAVYAKLEVNTNTGAVAKAIRKGII